MNHYENFHKAKTRKQWERIGLQRRAGVVSPLFSLYSKKSAGIGEIPDLKLLIDWCRRTGLSVIQLLPLNDVGFQFCPYDAQSTFALEPVYLSLEQVHGVERTAWTGPCSQLKQKFPAGKERVDYGIKRAKLEILWKMFQSHKAGIADHPAFREFVQTQKRWLEDYVLFKVIKENYGQSDWESWPDPLKRREKPALEQIKAAHADSLVFQEWLQWQLFEQFAQVKRFAGQQHVLLMGDLPFLVARDSADVWSHQDYFKLDLASGAPPDAYFAMGQRWGMPPYDWPRIEEHGYDYLKDKLRYAERFYDLYRIDHVVGTFRIWTIATDEPAETHGLNGKFDPPDENDWEAHGRKLLSVMIESTEMLPCAEDLGTVPECCFKVLEEFAVPGIDVQRWKKRWGTDFHFLPPEDYRSNSIAVASTHDMSSVRGWWEHEGGTVDEEMFRRLCEGSQVDYTGLRGKLFDLKASRFGRMRWKKEIDSKEAFLKVLGRAAEEVHEPLQAFLGSFDEMPKFWEYLGGSGNCPKEASHEMIEGALTKVHQTRSVFSIQMLQDWLALGGLIRQDSWSFRINFPGTMSARNWSLVMPVSLEEMLGLEVNDKIKSLGREAERE